MSKVTIWSIVKEYINLFVVGDTVTRRELRRYVSRYLYVRDGTIDKYRRMLTVTGYISTGNPPGVYKVLKPIPIDMKVTDLQREYSKKLEEMDV